MNNDANAGTNSSASGRCWSLSQMTDKAALTDPLNISLIIAALLCLALFVRVELRQAHPLLSLRIFAIGGYSLSVIIVVAQSKSRRCPE